MKKLILILVIGLSLFVTSCKKDIDHTPIPDVSTMGDLKVADDFNWKTFRDIQLDLTGPVKGIISVVSNNGKVYQKACLSPGILYSMNLTVANHETSVHLQYMGRDVIIELGSEHISYIFE